ncbi:hypothetical protein [Paenibacillus odorifer]|uniref:hypothetical protein n=1 Tax=Paenibacillus odorifer TaxID=189426 RepID=UPI00096D42D6|nr:hypothetical protein [Paenibacillus odorifer]OME56683.1 hypothetical protein BSK61_10805 [Paenibacillus odorifer]
MLRFLRYLSLLGDSTLDGVNVLKHYYLGIHQGLLEPISLNYVCFGALWFEENNHRYIVGYAFGQNQIQALRQFSTPSSCKNCLDSKIVYEIYKKIREQQQQQDWSSHQKLPWFTAFKEPWKDVSAGWYVLRSRSTFPLHLSVIRKEKFRLWLEHTAVCENKMEMLACVEKASVTHQVDLKLLEI